MEHLFGFIVAAIALTGSPGPNTLSLAATGAAFGGRRAMRYMVGVIAGMVVVMVLTGSGVSAALLALPGAMPVILTAVAVYFAYLAFRIATAPPLTDEAAARRQPSFAAGALLSLVNPKAYAAMAALFSSFVLVDGRLGLDLAAKTAVVVAILVGVNLSWVFGGAALTRFFRDPRTNRIINVAFAVLLIASLALALLV